MQQSVEEGCKPQVNGEELDIIDQTVKAVAMPIHIVEAEDGVRTL